MQSIQSKATVQSRSSLGSAFKELKDQIKRATLPYESISAIGLLPFVTSPKVKYSHMVIQLSQLSKPPTKQKNRNGQSTHGLIGTRPTRQVAPTLTDN